MSYISKAPYFYDAHYAADQLGVSVDVVKLLRRALDPNLSFEEHDEIFPLDLGLIWDLAGFSATKRHFNSINLRSGQPCTGTEKFLEAFSRKAAIRGAMKEWNSIYRQFAAIFHYGLMDQCYMPDLHNEGFVFQQSFVNAYDVQRAPRAHTDSANTWAAFEEAWESPTAVQLFVRDDDPNTLFFKGLKKVPLQLIDAPATEKERERRSEEDIRLKALTEKRMRKEGFSDELSLRMKHLDQPYKGLFFHPYMYTEMAEEAGKAVHIPAGHVVASTNRIVHRGQAVLRGKRRTFAFGGGYIRHPNLVYA